MKNNETERLDNFWSEMATRPYPFNRPTAVVAQALSVFSKLDAEDKERVILMHSSK